MKARLILENGMIFEGNAFGYLKESVGFKIISDVYDEVGIPHVKMKIEL